MWNDEENKLNVKKTYGLFKKTEIILKSRKPYHLEQNCADYRMSLSKLNTFFV